MTVVYTQDATADTNHATEKIVEEGMWNRVELE